MGGGRGMGKVEGGREMKGTAEEKRKPKPSRPSSLWQVETNHRKKLNDLFKLSFFLSLK